LAAVLVASPAVAAEPKLKPDSAGKIVHETWDAIYVQGQKSGYHHVTVREFTRDGQVLRRVAQEMSMTVKRGGAVNVIQAETGDEETLDGKVVGVFLKIGLARDLMVNNVGKIDGKVMRVKIQQKGKAAYEREIPWDDNVIGLIAEENLLKDRKAKPGDRISYRLYAPVVTNVVTTEVEVKEWEKVPLNGRVRKLLRVESKPDKVEEVQLPTQTLWFDEEYRVVQSQVEMPGIGELTYVRTTADDAKKPLGKVPDLFTIQDIVLNKLINNPHGQRAVTYRVTLTAPQKDIHDIEKTFATGDGRQEITVLSDNAFDLRIKAVRQPPATSAKAKVAEEYTKSNFFITSADARVKKHARAAVGDETDPWRKAQRIERWVRDNMTALNFDNGIAPADWVAEHLEGDCTEFAMLGAAMCRAEGVPSRTALGLVYHVAGSPKLSYHMWMEVNVNGQWVALDPTLGQGSVGPAHVKISDHSWHDVHSFTPLLPVHRVMAGKPKFEVLKVGE
jgi:hypothetical protein